MRLMIVFLEKFVKVLTNFERFYKNLESFKENVNKNLEKLNENYNFLLLSILIAGWGLGCCLPSFANFPGFRGGGKIFPFSPWLRHCYILIPLSVITKGCFASLAGKILLNFVTIFSFYCKFFLAQWVFLVSWMPLPLPSIAEKLLLTVYCIICYITFPNSC